METAVDSVCLEMQGVRIRLCCSDSEVQRYVPLHFPHHVVAGGPRAREPDIDVHLRWVEGDGDGPAAVAFPGQEELDRIGRRLRAGAGTLVWTGPAGMENLGLRLRLDGAQLQVEAKYIYAPGEFRLAARPHDRTRRRFDLMSWLVIHPLAWYLQHFRGWYLLHAAGVEWEGRGIVVAGPGGAGKTTIAAALLAHGGRFLSENLLFHDGERIYACYGPVRLDADSLQLLRGARLPVQVAAIPPGAKQKGLFHVERQALADAAPAALLCQPRFASSAWARPLGLDASLERLLTLQDLARQSSAAAEFAGALDLVWARRGVRAGRVPALRALLRRMLRFEIGIDPAAGLEPVVDALRERAALCP